MKYDSLHSCLIVLFPSQTVFRNTKVEKPVPLHIVAAAFAAVLKQAMPSEDTAPIEDDAESPATNKRKHGKRKRADSGTNTSVDSDSTFEEVEGSDALLQKMTALNAKLDTLLKTETEAQGKGKREEDSLQHTLSLVKTTVESIRDSISGSGRSKAESVLSMLNNISTNLASVTSGGNKRPATEEAVTQLRKDIERVLKQEDEIKEVQQLVKAVKEQMELLRVQQQLQQTANMQQQMAMLPALFAQQGQPLGPQAWPSNMNMQQPLGGSFGTGGATR